MEGLGGIWILLSASHLLFNKKTEFLRSWGRGKSVDHSLAIVKGGLVRGWAEVPLVGYGELRQRGLTLGHNKEDGDLWCSSFGELG